MEFSSTKQSQLHDRMEGNMKYIQRILHKLPHMQTTFQEKMKAIVTSSLRISIPYQEIQLE
jgi:hypothetical protein